MWPATLAPMRFAREDPSRRLIRSGGGGIFAQPGPDVLVLLSQAATSDREPQGAEFAHSSRAFLPDLRVSNLIRKHP